VKFKADVLGCSIGSINMLLESACNAVAFSGTYSPQALDCTVGFAMTCHAGPKALTRMNTVKAPVLRNTAKRSGLHERLLSAADLA
jgi:hypothetical protein